MEGSAYSVQGDKDVNYNRITQLVEIQQWWMLASSCLVLESVGDGLATA